MNLNPDQSPQAVQPNAPTPPPVQTVVPPQGSTPPPPSQKPSMMSNKLVLVGIVLLFLIPILGALGYFIIVKGQSNQEPEAIPTVIPITTEAPTETPTPTAVEETADWKTYTNTGSKYSVKYPSEQYVRLVCPGEELVLRTRQAADTKDEETFETCGRGGRFTIEVLTADSLTEPVEDDGFAVEKSDTTVADAPARKYITTKKTSNEGPGPDYSEDIYFELGGKKHMIHFDKGVPEDVKTNLLSSFKLI